MATATATATVAGTAQPGMVQAGMMADNGEGESKGGHHKFEDLRIGAPSSSLTPLNVTVVGDGDHVVMRFELRLRREEALKFATIMMNRGMSIKP